MNKNMKNQCSYPLSSMHGERTRVIFKNSAMVDGVIFDKMIEGEHEHSSVCKVNINTLQLSDVNKIFFSCTVVPVSGSLGSLAKPELLHWAVGDIVRRLLWGKD